MVREIIHIQVGQCGNQIGNIFWNTTCEEHHLNESGIFEKDKDMKTTHKVKMDNKDKNKDEDKANHGRGNRIQSKQTLGRSPSFFFRDSREFPRFLRRIRLFEKRRL